MTTTLDTTLTLSTQLREGTRAQHSEAEGQHFVTALMTGKLTREAYADLVVQHLVIYRALEEAGAQVSRLPGGSGIVFEELIRVPAIQADLRYLYGTDWAVRIDILPATEVYAARLHAVSDWVGGWAAHAYTRYLGDLSGGQVIRTMLGRHYGLTDDGVSFYHFPQVAKPKVFKDHYRAALDALPLAEGEQSRVVAEAQEAFRLNTALFAGLDERHLA